VGSSPLSLPFKDSVSLSQQCMIEISALFQHEMCEFLFSQKLYSGAKRRRDGRLVTSRSSCGSVRAPAKYLITGFEHTVRLEGLRNKLEGDVQYFTFETYSFAHIYPVVG